MPRRRLDPQQRREQLLDTGAAMFAERPYEDVFVDDIAARAGVSRATLYHYFPSKRDLYAAIFQRASRRLLTRANPDPQLPLADQVARGLEAHIQYFADHPFEAIAINRGALSDDPAIQAITTEELNALAKHLIDQLITEGGSREVTEVALAGWLAFVRAACVEWVQSHSITRADLTEMCLRAFDCALGYPNMLRGRPAEPTHQHPRREYFGGLAATTTGSEHQNHGARPFTWKATAGGIIAKVQRGRDALRQIKTQALH